MTDAGNYDKYAQQQMGCDPGEWIDLAEDRDQWRTYVRAVINLRVPYKLISCVVMKAGIVNF